MDLLGCISRFERLYVSGGELDRSRPALLDLYEDHLWLLWTNPSLRHDDTNYGCQREDTSDSMAYSGNVRIGSFKQVVVNR